MSEERKKWEARGVFYDDRTSEEEPLPQHQRGLKALLSPDEMDCQWVRGERGWLSLRDPITLEWVEVPTKYASYLFPPGTIPAPQEWVYRAMDKLPPKKKLPPPAPFVDDGGPL